MTPDDVILQLVQMLVIDTPLRHWTKTGVDAIYDLVLGKLFQEQEASIYPILGIIVKVNQFLALDD